MLNLITVTSKLIYVISFHTFDHFSTHSWCIYCLQTIPSHCIWNSSAKIKPMRAPTMSSVTLRKCQPQKSCLPWQIFDTVHTAAPIDFVHNFLDWWIKELVLKSRICLSRWGSNLRLGKRNSTLSHYLTSSRGSRRRWSSSRSGAGHTMVVTTLVAQGLDFRAGNATSW